MAAKKVTAKKVTAKKVASTKVAATKVAAILQLLQSKCVREVTFFDSKKVEEIKNLPSSVSLTKEQFKELAKYCWYEHNPHYKQMSSEMISDYWDNALDDELEPFYEQNLTKKELESRIKEFIGEDDTFQDINSQYARKWTPEEYDFYF